MSHCTHKSKCYMIFLPATAVYFHFLLHAWSKLIKIYGANSANWFVGCTRRPDFFIWDQLRFQGLWVEQSKITGTRSKWSPSWIALACSRLQASWKSGSRKQTGAKLAWGLGRDSAWIAQPKNLRKEAASGPLAHANHLNGVSYEPVK